MSKAKNQFRKKMFLILLLFYLIVLAVLTFISNDLQLKAAPCADVVSVSAAWFDGVYYDMVVPKKAVKSDENGQFVFCMEERNTPLGKRTMAHKRYISIKHEDLSSECFAISGPVTLSDKILLGDLPNEKTGFLVVLKRP